MRGNFEIWRAWGTEKLPQTSTEINNAFAALKKQKLIPEKLTLEQYNAWLVTKKDDFEALLDVSQDDLQRTARAALEQAVADEHIAKEDMHLDFEKNRNALNMLMLPIMDINREISALKKEYKGLKKKRKTIMKNPAIPADVKNRFYELQNQVKTHTEEHRQRIDELKAWLYISTLRRITMAELEQQGIKIGKTLVKFRELFGTGDKPGIFERVFAEKNPDFYADLRRMYTQLMDAYTTTFSGARVSKSKLDITDKVRLQTHIRIGSEPVESCQHFDGNGSLNEGLLSYSTDPNIRIIQIYDENGNIMTRSILRLMEDEKGQPHLFLERVYSKSNHSSIIDAVTNFAARKAKAMGIKLWTANITADAKYDDQPTTLYSRGSRSAAVYTDAGGGLAKNGEYQIHALARAA